MAVKLMNAASFTGRHANMNIMCTLCRLCAECMRVSFEFDVTFDSSVAWDRMLSVEEEQRNSRKYADCMRDPVHECEQLYLDPPDVPQPLCSLQFHARERVVGQGYECETKVSGNLSSGNVDTNQFCQFQSIQNQTLPPMCSPTCTLFYTCL